MLLFLVCEPVYSLFTTDPQVLTLAKTIMLIEIPLELGRAVNMTMCRALQACGDIRFPIIICVIDAWIVGVGGSWLLGVVFDMGLAGPVDRHGGGRVYPGRAFPLALAQPRLGEQAPAGKLKDKRTACRKRQAVLFTWVGTKGSPTLPEPANPAASRAITGRTPQVSAASRM